MHHIVYKITNMLNGKYYVGKHSTKNLEDNYWGSSEDLNEDIKKEGLHNFKKEIVYDSMYEEDALEFEAQIVDDEFIKSSRTYNKTLGGRGSWTLKNYKNFSKENRINKWKQSIFGKDLGKKFDW